MIKIQIFTQRSVLIVLLVSSAINPLLAFPTKSHLLTEKSQEAINVFQKIKDTLIDKGLEDDIALEKTMKLFQAQKNTVERLKSLYESSELVISKEDLVNKLAKYALYEKKLDLNSYSSLIGLVQSVLSHPLNNKELNHLQEVTLKS